MKLSTAKYLRTVEIQNSGGNVLDQARRILRGKINDRLGAEVSSRNILQSIFKRDILIQIAQLEGLDKNNPDIEANKKFGLSMRLIPLKLQIFSILDRTDARIVWQKIVNAEGIEKIKNDSSFFYHVFHGPLSLLLELYEKGFLPPELASIFPRSCIIDDYDNSISPSNPESATYQHIQDLQADIKQAENDGNTQEVERLQSQLKVIGENIQRYF